MAAVKGVNVTLHDAGGQGDNAIANGLVNVRPEVWTDTYEAVALASASTIDMAKLPVDAKIQNVELYFDALGSSVTLQVGDSNDDNRYIASGDASSAGKLSSALIDGIGYVIGTNTGDTVVQVLTGGTSFSGTVKLIVTFTR